MICISNKSVIRKYPDELKKSVHSDFCFYCGKKLTTNNATYDHIIPICKGGKTTESNIVRCCNKCNNIKGGYTVSELIDVLNKRLRWATCPQQRKDISNWLVIFINSQKKIKEEKKYERKSLYRH